MMPDLGYLGAVRRVALALLAVLAPACAAVTTAQYRDASVGPLGCPEDEVTISEHRNVIWVGQGMTWRASCRGKTFICSMAGAVATCSEEMGSAPATATPGGGCEYDTQCKGERVCVNRTCVDPTAAQPAAQPRVEDWDVDEPE